MTTVVRVVVFCIFATALAVTPAVAQAPCTSASSACRGRIGVDGQWRIPYWRTHALGMGHSSATRAIIVIHGSERNADLYFSYVVSTTQAQGELDRTVVIAPHFQTAEDGPAGDELIWPDAWKQGNQSLNGGRISSFAVLDAVISRLADRTLYPNLRRIVITGHSAGGQFTNRFAAGSLAPTMLTSHEFLFVVANPSSYMYLTRERPVLTDPTRGRFAVPTTACSFNDYRYGLDDLNTYMRALTPDALRSNYRTRAVIYLLGSADVNSSTDDFDDSCAANLQGANRFERGNWFFSFMSRLATTHSRLVVRDVGHSARQIYTSDQGKRAIFERQFPASGLTGGASLRSENGSARLSYQSDGNLVLFNAMNVPVWMTGTTGTAPGVLMMQEDGNLVLYDGNRVPRWASNTAGNVGAHLFLQNDTNLTVVGRTGERIWSARP